MATNAALQTNVTLRTTPVRFTLLERLPEEIVLLILGFIQPWDLWLKVRHVNSVYRSYAEDVASKLLVPQFDIGLRFNLSSGNVPRWYDVRGTVNHRFRCINRPNPQYALFETASITPEAQRDRVLETWKRMCAQGFGPAQEWRVKFMGTDIEMHMPRVVPADGDGIYCDWRELLDVYFARLPTIWEECINGARIGMLAKEHAISRAFAGLSNYYCDCIFLSLGRTS
ncbi:hypothetical protein BDY17DRAFT_200176 [Neohortaea acidophila]|uniref:F-box domain-containing protein n=1 Tax=Neohortaea acidophila TaxID=245834 RepID=A0A6A6PMV3_9PEZI|nr:uncharacterized protein BDY17DRAFT_200176 [Neohortaea acidophila]KAF2480773.1 hypothetical protein BDY17DRAFT_200176 [Neohortaea acidophila]